MRLPRNVQRGALAVILTAALAPWTHAHDPVPDHGCRAPERPENDQDDVLWQGFLDAVDGYRQCISDFAAANRRAAQAHSRAANQATQAWNAFVRRELNVPEDYPWPPKAAR